MSMVILNRMYGRFRVQMKSTEMWMGMLKQRRDEPNIRNAAFALGKLSGMGTMIMEVTLACKETLPDDIRIAIEAGPEQWDIING